MGRSQLLARRARSSQVGRLLSGFARLALSTAPPKPPFPCLAEQWLISTQRWLLPGFQFCSVVPGYFELVEQHRVHLLVAHLSAAPLSVLKCNC